MLHRSPIGCPGCSMCHRAVSGCIPGGREREGWPDPARTREEHVQRLTATATPQALLPTSTVGRVWFPGGKHPGERLHIHQGNSLFGRQLPLAAELPHLCPLQERKKLSPGAPQRSGACGTFHLMRILFILSGATNLSSEHFVLIKN